MNNEVYFKNDSWHICVRVLNPFTKKISYDVLKGYRSKQEALKVKEEYDLRYENDMKNARKSTEMRFTFQEYMEYWLKEEYIKVASKGSHEIAKWTIYNLIIPNMKQDMFLPYVTADFVNEIIENCKPICDSAGQVTSRFLERKTEILNDTWECPNCGECYEVDYDDYDYRPKCGQKIDWSE